MQTVTARLDSLFQPRSIALIGASTDTGSVGYDIAKNLTIGSFAGEVFFVNPKAQSLFDRPCYKTIGDISAEIDLALIVVPAKIVPQVLREAGEKGVRAAVVISSGFKETGEAGAQLENEIRDIATRYGIALLGPNCLGFIAPRIGLNASFASAIPREGSIAFCSQSGALMSALLDGAKDRLGFSAFVSLGNKTALSEASFFEHFGAESDTRVMGCYTEGLTDGPRIIALGRRLAQRERPTPIIALKSGKTEAGTAASSSHTGAVAGSREALAALFRQARIVEAHTFAELVDLLAVFSANPLPRGRRLAIVTNAGGFGVLATDAAIESGLQLASLSQDTQEKLRSVLPPAGSVKNPVDLLGDAKADRYAQALEFVAEDPAVDLLLVLLTPQTMTEPEVTAKALVAIRDKKPTLPLVAVFAGEDLVLPGKRLLRQAGIATLDSPEAGARALGQLATAGEWSRETSDTPLPRLTDAPTEQAKSMIAHAIDQKRFQWNERDTRALLKLYGLPFLETAVVSSRDEALAEARGIGRPVVLKIVSPDIIHKSDVGGVRLNVAPDDVSGAYDELLATVKKNMPQARIEGVSVAEMAQSGGLELIFGLKKEPGLGTLLVVGLGGIYVEMFHDISLRFLPLSMADIDEMLGELKTLPILHGARGQAGIDLGRLKELMARLAQFALDCPEVEALDLNPVLAFPNGRDFRILDARLTLTPRENT